MSLAIVTGSAGLIGSETCRRLSAEGFDIVGLDNDMRAEFFGPAASTRPTQEKLIRELPSYRHHALDIRDAAGVDALFRKLGSAVKLIVHTAAQPSHDWAARAPLVDFGVNAVGTLHLLEATRQHCPEAVFIFTSTNKVYGDTPNRLPLIELEQRWEIASGHAFEPGIDESMSIDQTKHSLFGASKVAADVLVQEYGRYFGMKTACFRGGCLTDSGGASSVWCWRDASVDEYFDHCFGPLPYRSLRFEPETLPQEYFQPALQVNYPNEHDFTRIVELKHATGQKLPVTTIVREYPEDFGPGKEPYYPIPAPDARALYEKYATRAEQERGVSFVGRLATYRYYNMDQVVGMALAEFEKLPPFAA